MRAYASADDSGDGAVQPHFHCAIYFTVRVVAANVRAYHRHHYKGSLIGQSIGCSCRDLVACC